MDGWKNECATYTDDIPGFSAEVGRKTRFRAGSPPPSCTPRKDVALPISPRDNERENGLLRDEGGCHLVWDRKSSSEGGREGAATATIRLSSSLQSSSSRPSIRPRPSAFGGETTAPRPERAAFFRGKPPLRKIISGDTYRFFRPALPVARNHVTDRDSSRPCGGREDEERLCRAGLISQQRRGPLLSN